MEKRKAAKGGMKKIFYIFFFAVILFVVVGVIASPSEKNESGDGCREFAAEWEQVFADGTREAIRVPGSCVAQRGETAVAETVIPEYVEDGKWLCLRSSQQDMRVYIDGELREEYDTEDTRIFGKTSVSTYVFVQIYKADAGKVLRVETESLSGYSGTMNTVYYGDKFSIWEYFAEQYGMQLIIALFMLVLAIICIVFSIVLKCSHSKNIVLEYLGWGVLLVAVWIIAENRLRQLYFPNVSVMSSVTFFSLMLLPLPFAIYINSIQEFRYKKCYHVIYALVTIDFVGCSVLQILNILDFFQTMIVMHTIIIASVIVVVVTIFIDIKKKYIGSYRLVALGLASLMVAGIVEILKVYFNNGQVSGNGLCVALIFLLIMAAIKTGQDILRLERERQRILLDNETKTGFLAKMSHEIRTPINTIIGMNEMIARENKDEALEQYVAGAHEAGKTLLALVNDVLDFSRMESGHLNLTENVYQLASLINDEVHMIQARAEKKQLEVQVNVEEKLPSYLYGDEVRIKQIVSNLLSNAVKYTEEGAITFTVGCVTSDTGQFFLKISVADTGVGIQEKDMERLFDSFAKLDEKKNVNVSGTGLGLNIIKQLLDEMQGEIKVRSIYGKGSLFTVIIPQKVIDAEPIGMIGSEFLGERTQLSKYQSSFIAPQARVLAVDDNDMNLAVVKGFLKRTQVQLDTALSGTQCLELCKDNHYHVILMDHMMPEPDGIQTLQMLREQQDGCNVNTPVVVLTANAVAGSREGYLSDGFAEYLSKPIVSDKLERVLQQFIPEELIIPQETGEPEREEHFAMKGFPGIEEEAEISKKLGMSYCGGDEEVYGELLRAYYKQGKTYAEKLPEYFAKNDWKNYAIIAHALKSTSLNIGARKFSDMAKEHEMAGKEERGAWIEEHWKSFYESLLKVLETAEAMLPEDVEKARELQEAEEISREEYLKECELLLEYLGNYEMNASMEQVNQLEKLETADMDFQRRRALFEEIRSTIDEFDYGKAAELLEDWMKGV